MSNSEIREVILEAFGASSCCFLCPMNCCFVEPLRGLILVGYTVAEGVDGALKPGVIRLAILEDAVDVGTFG